jgi:hypothetical protein
VIAASQTGIVGITILKLGHSVRTPFADQAELTAESAEQNEVFTQHTNGKNTLCEELAGWPERNPIPAQELSHRCPRTHSRQSFICLGTQHANVSV